MERGGNKDIYRDNEKDMQWHCERKGVEGEK